MLSTSQRCVRQSAKTPNTRFWLTRNKIASRHPATQIGGSVCARRLPAYRLLNRSCRTFAFGSALGAVENLDAAGELLFAAALLHDAGLVRPADGADFTRAGEQIARDVAQGAGLSAAAADTMRTAITLTSAERIAAPMGATDVKRAEEPGPVTSVLPPGWA
jgi:hypothetical protein